MPPVLFAQDEKIQGGGEFLLLTPFCLKDSGHTEGMHFRVTEFVFSRFVPTELSSKGTGKRYYYFFYWSVSLSVP